MGHRIDRRRAGTREKIDFTAAYVEIEATYLVPAGSPIATIAEVDVKGNRIAVTARSAYDLWLERNVHNATLHRGNNQAATIELFLNEKMEALAGLHPGLIGDAAKIPGSRILDGQFTAVQQAIGTPKKNAAGAAYLKQFVENAKKSGDVAALIQKHGVVGRLSWHRLGNAKRNKPLSSWPDSSCCCPAWSGCVRGRARSRYFAVIFRLVPGIGRGTELIRSRLEAGDDDVGEVGPTTVGNQSNRSTRRAGG